MVFQKEKQGALSENTQPIRVEAEQHHFRVLSESGKDVQPRAMVHQRRYP
jgi:hypothetical protein